MEGERKFFELIKIGFLSLLVFKCLMEKFFLEMMKVWEDLKFVTLGTSRIENIKNCCLFFSDNFLRTTFDTYRFLYKLRDTFVIYQTQSRSWWSTSLTGFSVFPKFSGLLSFNLEKWISIMLLTKWHSVTIAIYLFVHFRG